MHCDVCWASHICWKFHCKMPDMRGGRMEEIRKKTHAISSSEQAEQSGLVCGEQSVWCYGLVPTPTWSRTYFLVFFCLPGWHPDSLDFTLHKCCFSGHSGVLEVVGVIVQPSVLAELPQHNSTRFALLMINWAEGNDHPIFSLHFIFNFLRPHQTLREILSIESYHMNMWKLI